MTDTGPVRPLRLLVVDDHEVVRQGLVALLDRRPGFRVVAEAGTVEEAMAQARRHEPDLVIMDVRLPDGSGIEACRDIRAELPGTRPGRCAGGGGARRVAPRSGRHREGPDTCSPDRLGRGP